MAADDFVSLTGNLTRAPELRFTAGGKGVAEFGLAVNKRVRDSQGGWTNGDAMFIDVTVWDPYATNLANSGLGPGDRVSVKGRLELDAWQDQMGNKRSKHKVTAEDVSVSLVFNPVQIIKGEPAGNGGYQQTQTYSAPQAPQRQAPAPQAQQQAIPQGEPWAGNPDPFT